MTKKNLDEEPWYKDGLRFSCTECGQCCTGAPGYVWVTENEVAQMAEQQKISVEQFVHRYLRLVKGRLSLREDPKTYDCVFLKGKKCSLYNSRPKQCRTFPFWPDNLESPETWISNESYCEGINNGDTLIPLEQIRETLKNHCEGE
ncbi:MAG: Fe-S-cluster containining protein [Chlamydiales bacterium]|jgi:Fe-S-cluster containining protein